MVKIYTKTGDRGQTGTMRGRTGKDEAEVSLLGTIDELNSWLGLIRGQLKAAGFEKRGRDRYVRNIDGELRRVQGNLMKMSASVAGSKAKVFKKHETERLEGLIDRMGGELPVLKNFIYPTGIGPAGYLQVARSVCRRVERKLVGFSGGRDQKSLGLPALAYVNRLSDALFVLARWVNLKMGGDEEVWR